MQCLGLLSCICSADQLFSQSDHQRCITRYVRWQSHACILFLFDQLWCGRIRSLSPSVVEESRLILLLLKECNSALQCRDLES